MKRWSTLLLVCAILVSLCACGEVESPAVESTGPEQTQNAVETILPGPELTPDAAEPAVPEPEPTLEADKSAEPTSEPTSETDESAEPTPEVDEPAEPTPEPTPEVDEPAELTPEPTPEMVEPTAPEPEPTPTPVPVRYDPAEPIEYEELLEVVNTARRAELERENTFDGFEDYLVNDPAIEELVTEQEAELLKNGTGDQPETVTYEEAVSDVDLLFRSFHVGYGAYYYFGEETFQQAESEVLDWLKGQKNVSVEELKQVLRNSTAFMRDAHSWIAVPTTERTELWYEYYRCDDQSYTKDELGYYKTQNGEKWYFVSFSDDQVTMQPSLLETGELVYAPVLFCPADEMANSTVTLKNGAGVRRTERLIWERTASYSYKRPGDPDYKFLEEDGVAYISIRNFHENEYPEIFEQFIQSGTEARDSKVLIMDLRSNGGGTGWSATEWVKNFTGQEPEKKEIKSTRYSVLRKSERGTIGYVPPNKNTTGKFIKNRVPIILLVDDLCGSAGERTLNTLKTLENVLVVGTNSAGYQIGGSVENMYLPYSQIEFQVGTELWFANEISNVDCRGYEPDVWCDPQVALESALNMIRQYDLADPTGAEKVYDALKNINLIYSESKIPENAGFGGRRGQHIIRVQINGTVSEDYTVKSSNPAVCACEKRDDGTFLLSCTQAGECVITITSGKTTAQFRWRG